MSNEESLEEKVEEILTILATDKYYEVRMIVAKKTTNENILAILANDNEPDIRMVVANRTTNQDLLAKLANDEEWQVREEVALKTTNKDLLIQLSNDRSDLVRNVAVKRFEAWLATPEGQKEQLKGLQEALQQLNEDPNSSDNVKRIIIEEINKLNSSTKIANLSKTVNLFYKIVQAISKSS